MRTYLDLLNDIMTHGTDSDDRTGVGTRRVFGRQLRFNLREGFPAMTTKKLMWKSVVGELLWFIEGSSDERRLAEITHGTRDSSKRTIWTDNAHAAYWEPHAKYPGDLGRVYGVQWRDWRGVDQLQNLIHGLRTKPFDRRHILSSWNVDEIPNMALPPCHVLSQYFVDNGRLSCQMYQRSVDVFLGLPFNIASYALLTHLLAQVCDLEVGELIVSTGDTHVYANHFDQVREQLTRSPLKAPQLRLTPGIKDITLFTPEDIELVGYESLPPIKAPMAV